METDQTHRADARLGLALTLPLLERDEVYGAALVGFGRTVGDHDRALDVAHLPHVAEQRELVGCWKASCVDRDDTEARARVRGRRSDQHSKVHWLGATSEPG